MGQTQGKRIHVATIIDVEAFIPKEDLCNSLKKQEDFEKSLAAEEIEGGLGDAFIANEDLGDSLDRVEELKKKQENFEKSVAVEEKKIEAEDKFPTELIENELYACEEIEGGLGDDMKANEAQLLDPNTIAERLTTMRRTKAAKKFSKEIDVLNQRWDTLKQVMWERTEVQHYHRDADKIIDKIDEEENLFNSNYFDHDLVTIQRLKYEKFKQRFDIIEEEVKDLNGTAQRLMHRPTLSDQALTIFNHQAEIKNRWEGLANKAAQREAKLLDSQDLQNFLRDFRGLTTWIKIMMDLVLSDELAKDVTGNKALFERHEGYKIEIDAQYGLFQAFKTFGQKLLQNHHHASDEVRSKLAEVAEARQNFDRAWIARHAKLKQCLFNLHCEQAETWMTACEAWLEGRVNKPIRDVEALLKKQEKFDRAANSQEEKIAGLKSHADRLIQSDHCDIPGIVRRLDEVLERLHKVKDVLADNRANLLEAQLLQQYIDCGFLRFCSVAGPPKADTNSQVSCGLQLLLQRRFKCMRTLE